jgi:ZIP family zinc transporter
MGAAVALAIGIGLQNIPEGLAIALPLRRGGMTPGRAFFWGQLSAAVEPIGGAMLYVVVEELIPETARSGSVDVATLGFVIGFAAMMTLDNALR